MSRDTMATKRFLDTFPVLWLLIWAFGGRGAKIK